MAEGYWYEVAALGRYGRQPYDVVREMDVSNRARLYRAVRKLVESENESRSGLDMPGEDS